MELFERIHADYNELDFQKIWENGIFVFDANVLLDLYRLPKSASKDLVDILKDKKLKDRIWIPFQVLIEFLNNRFEAISDQKNKFNSVRTIINDTISQYDELMDNLVSELNKLKLKQRHSLINPDKYISEEKIKKGIKFLNDFIGALDNLEDKQSDVNDIDEVKKVVLEIFNDKIGKSFTKEELAEIYKEGNKRYEDKIPPGYKDIKKEGFHVFEDKEYVRKYGDLIFWKEIIQKAKSDKIEYLVLVTGDIKEDWWFEKRGMKLGPRNELLNEIYYNAPELITFYMYDTSSFLKYAKKLLRIEVKDSSISETKNLIELSRQDKEEENDNLISLEKSIREVSNGFSNVRIGLSPTVTKLPKVHLSKIAFNTTLSEIFSNVSAHSSNKFVGISAKTEGDMIQLRFRNRIHQKDFKEDYSSQIRGKGFEVIKHYMYKENIDVHFTSEQKHFAITLFIPKG